MTMTLRTGLSVTLWLGSALALGCGAGSDDEVDASASSAGGKADDPDDIDEAGYVFVEDAQFTVPRDHAGAPLLATIWGRIAEYSIEAPFIDRHAYNDSEGATNAPWLVHIVDRFKTIHDSWAPSFEAMGLDTCDEFGLTDDPLWVDGEFDFDALEPEQCFGQRVLWPNPETGRNERYRRVVQVSIPDYLTVRIEDPAAFPNGRVLHEQINSLMFAMAFLDHGGNCTVATSGSGEGQPTEDCDLHTLWKRSDFLKQQNDVPFAGASAIGSPATVFPFLGRAHQDE